MSRQTTKVVIRGQSRMTFTPKVKVGSVVDQAQSRIGKLMPVAKGSKEKSRAMSCTPNASGQSAWYLLECGIRVCVSYKDWSPFHWVAPPKTNTKGTTYYDGISKDDTANPYLNND